MRSRRKKTINSSSSGVSSDDLSDDYSEEDSSTTQEVSSPDKVINTSELSRLNKELQDLTVLKAQLENEKTQNCDKLAAAQSQLRDWESKCSHFEERIRALTEEKCELEEQENDSRLQSQR